MFGFMFDEEEVQTVKEQCIGERLVAHMP
ncbi:MAG: hypothetical protein EZS28_030817, partial [Streblomastix strix]